MRADVTRRHARSSEARARRADVTRRPACPQTKRALAARTSHAPAGAVQCSHRPPREACWPPASWDRWTAQGQARTPLLSTSFLFIYQYFCIYFFYWTAFFEQVYSESFRVFFLSDPSGASAFRTSSFSEKCHYRENAVHCPNRR